MLILDQNVLTSVHLDLIKKLVRVILIGLSLYLRGPVCTVLEPVTVGLGFESQSGQIPRFKSTSVHALRLISLASKSF